MIWREAELCEWDDAMCCDVVFYFFKKQPFIDFAEDREEADWSAVLGKSGVLTSFWYGDDFGCFPGCEQVV